MLNMCVCVHSAAVLEPDVGAEHHRRSSSMRVTGTSYRSSLRERSSDDCIIGTHLGMGTLHMTTKRKRICQLVTKNQCNLHRVGWAYTKFSKAFQPHSEPKTFNPDGNFRHSAEQRHFTYLFLFTDKLLSFKDST